jgi:hypothetical protein
VRCLDQWMSIRSAKHRGMFIGHDDKEIGRLVCRHGVLTFGVETGHDPAFVQSIIVGY